MIAKPVETFQFDAIDDVLSDIAKGRMVVVTDDADRENEGDLVMAAEKVTPEAVNFMAMHGRGLICVPISNERADQLGLAFSARLVLPGRRMAYHAGAHGEIHADVVLDPIAETALFGSQFEIIGRLWHSLGSLDEVQLGRIKPREQGLHNRALCLRTEARSENE